MRCPVRLMVSILLPALLAGAAELADIPPQQMLRRPAKAVTVDANLAEWDLAATPMAIDPELPDQSLISRHANDPENPLKGTADLSARVALAWDETYLYVAAAVADDQLRGIRPGVAHNVGPAGWACDSVMMQIHSFRDPLKTNTPYADSPFLAFRYEAKDGGRGQLLDNTRGDLDKADSYWKLPEGSQLATAETPDGYLLEAAVPWASLAFAARPGKSLYISFLLGDIDDKEALNQLGWGFAGGDPRGRQVFRLDDGTGVLAILNLAADAVPVGSNLVARYEVDALAADAKVDRLAVKPAAGAAVELAIGTAIPAGRRASDVVTIGPLPAQPGPSVVELLGTVAGKAVVLASQPLELREPAPPTPLVVNPPGEISRMRPDRIAHHAEEDHRRNYYRHDFVKDRTGYEQYILTRVKSYVDTVMPSQVAAKSVWTDSYVLRAYTLYKLTGEERYAELTRQGLEVIRDYQRAKADVNQLGRLPELQYFIGRDPERAKLMPEDFEETIGAAWRQAHDSPEPWLFTEWGYHNRCWHRWGHMRIMKHYMAKTGGAFNPRMQEYLDWHDERLVSLGDTTDNSSGYHWVWWHYPVKVAMIEGNLDALGAHPGYVAALTRYRQFASPTGAVPHFGDTSGWLTGAGEALSNYEMMGRLTRDGRFRWQAHRIAEYLYNHFWPDENQYHGPRDQIAGGFCLAWLWADETVPPTPAESGSRVTMRPRIVDMSPEEEASKPGLGFGRITAELVPDKLILTSGNSPRLWAMVEVLDRGGHSGQLPGHVVTLLQYDSALLAGQGYYEKSQDFNNVVWVEDLEGLAADPRPLRTEIPALTDDPMVTHARLRVRRYSGLPIDAVRDFVFVKNGFILVKDQLTFNADMKVRVGPCWQTRNLGPDCGRTWFNTYYDQLYHTGLGLGRGVHAVENPAWDLLVAFSPRQEYVTSVVDRYDDNPYRVSPIQLRQSWSGIVRRGETRTFVSVLLPHPPAFDVEKYANDIAWAVDTDRSTLVQVRVEEPGAKQATGYWVLLQEETAPAQAEGFASDAALAVARLRPDGTCHSAVMVGGSQLTVNGEDVAARARQPQPKAVYVLPPEE